MRAMASTMAVVFEREGVVGLSAAEVPDPGLGEALVRTRYTTVSPGTELRSLAGKQVGMTSWGFVPGYSIAGEVVAVGDGVSLPVGTAVQSQGTAKANLPLLWGGQIGFAVAPAAALVPIPAGVGLAEASFATMCGIAQRGVHASRFKPGWKVAVVGLGLIGQLSARLFRLAGVELRAYDLEASRIEAAREGGVEAFDAREAPDGWADLVVDATGTEAAFRSAIAIGKDKPWGDTDQESVTVLVQGSYPEDVPVPYDMAFRKEATLIFPRSCQQRDKSQCLEMMAAGKLNLDGLMNVQPFSKAVEAYGQIRARQTITATFDWADA